MKYQIDTRRLDQRGLRIGRDDVEIAVFGKAKSLFDHLEGTFDDVEYRMKLPAPWTGFRYRLLQGKEDVATAKRQIQTYAFDPERPFSRHKRVDFLLDVDSRSFRIFPEDHFGYTYMVHLAEDQCGSVVQRSFADQRDGLWEADLEAPEDWSVPLVAFLAWLAREGRPFQQNPLSISWK